MKLAEVQSRRGEGLICELEDFVCLDGDIDVRVSTMYSNGAITSVRITPEYIPDVIEALQIALQAVVVRRTIYLDENEPGWREKHPDIAAILEVVP